MTNSGNLPPDPWRPPVDDPYVASPPPPHAYPPPPQPYPPSYQPGPYPQPYYPPPPPQFAGYRCRFCGSPYPPQVVKRFGAAAWTMLVVGFFFCIVGMLFALACMEEKRICPSCGSTLN
ncbi:MAG TPA: LITAF-like zinc ribbon domain-containing protein [Pyrinomonadaceae bacterium]|nr:LITAF-like zinc ribbon domain-containing protein [Pyrinomonadaceae bacterium]